jgi:hypothetical protein
VLAVRNDKDGDDVALRERVDRLEARIARIESDGAQVGVDEHEAQGSPSYSLTHPSRADRLWALDGLKERVEEPGAVLFTGSVSTPNGGHYEWQQAHPTSAILDDDWAEPVGRLTALAHPIRLLLLHEVLHGTHTAGELSAHERLGTTGQLYHHLRQLVAAGWLRAGGQGRYDVPGERVVPLLVILAAVRR